MNGEYLAKMLDTHYRERQVTAYSGSEWLDLSKYNIMTLGQIDGGECLWKQNQRDQFQHLATKPNHKKACSISKPRLELANLRTDGSSKANLPEELILLDFIDFISDKIPYKDTQRAPNARSPTHKSR